MGQRPRLYPTTRIPFQIDFNPSIKIYCKMKTNVMQRFICFLIALLALNSNIAQVTIREINHDCNATCKGRITWELEVKQSPMAVVLLKNGQVHKASRTFKPGKHVLLDDQLCKGTYQLLLNPVAFPTCGLSSDPVNLMEKSFDFDIFKFDGFKITFTFSEPGSYFTRKAFNETGPFPPEGSGRGYIEMSRQELDTHNGVFYVKATNSIGCEVIKQFRLDCMENFTANIGIEPVAGDPNKVKLKALVFDASFQLVDLSQIKLGLAWWAETWRATPLGSGTEIIVAKSKLGNINGVLSATLEVTTTCNSAPSINEGIRRGQIVTKIIDCQGNGDPASAFVKKIDPFCAVGNRGAITFDPKWESILIKVNGQRLLPGDPKFVNNLQAGSYEIDIEGCSSFFVTVPEEESALKFVKLKKENDNPSLCVYKAKCEEDEHDFTKEYPVKLDFNSATTPLCAVPTYCDYDGFRRDFDLISFSTERQVAAVYVRMLKSRMAISSGETYDKLKVELDKVSGLKGCNIVKFCPTTLERISEDNGVSVARDNDISCKDGCEFIDCRWLGGFFGKVYDACELAPNYVADTRNCCGPGGEKIKISYPQLAYAYFSLNQIELEQLYLSMPQFEDSQLEKTLKTHIAPLFAGLDRNHLMEAFTRDPRLACIPEVEVCTDSYKLVHLSDELKDILVPNPLNDVASNECGRSMLALPWSLDDREGKRRKASVRTQTCAIHPDFAKAGAVVTPSGKTLLGVYSCGSQEYKPLLGKKRLVGEKNIEIWDGKGLGELLNPPAPFGPQDEVPVSYLSELTTESNAPVADPRFKIMVDSVSNQSFLSLSTINSNGNLIPKLLFKENEINRYYNYSHDIALVQSLDMKNVELLHEDWGENKTIAVLRGANNKEFMIASQDTTQLIVLPIVSDSLLKVSHLSKTGNAIFVGGHYYGRLFLGGQAFDSIPDYQKASIFLGRLSLEGEIEDVLIIENIDTLGGLFFSENQSGTITLTAQARGNSLLVDGVETPLLDSNSMFVGKYEYSNGFQLLNQTIGHSGFKIAGIALAADKQEIAVALFGSGEVTSINNAPSLVVGQKLNLLRFNGQGGFIDAISCPSDKLNYGKTRICYGAQQTLTLGITYRDSVQIFDTTLTSFGNEDIAIIKFKKDGNFHWLRDFGTEDQESLSQLFYNKDNTMYFAGEFSGNISETRRLGDYIFYDTTGQSIQRVFLSYIPDTLAIENIPELEALQTELKLEPRLELAATIRKLSVQPNPFTNQTTVICTTTEAGQYTLVVQNELGKVISQQSVELGLGQNSQVLSTQQFTPGFYYLTLRNAKGKVVGAQKLIKQ